MKRSLDHLLRLVARLEQSRVDVDRNLVAVHAGAFTDVLDEIERLKALESRASLTEIDEDPGARSARPGRALERLLCSLPDPAELDLGVPQTRAVMRP